MHDFLRDALVGEDVEVERQDGGFPVRHRLHYTVTVVASLALPYEVEAACRDLLLASDTTPP